MLKKVIDFIVKLILSILRIDPNRWKNSMENGAATSAHVSHESEDAARKAAEEAARKAKEGGTDDDVFGAKTY